MNHKTTEELLRENESLRQEINDLKLLLDAITGHSDGVEHDLLGKIDETVRESEKRFRVITETIPVPVMITRESDGTILYANGHAAALFGISKKQLLKHKAAEFYDPKKRQILLNILTKQGFLKNYELQGKRADGMAFWVELSIQPMLFNQEPSLLSVWHEITQRRILELQLRQIHKMEAVGTLAGGIAHDFNNILGIILGSVELAKVMLPEESKAIPRLNIAMDAVNRAKSIVMQLLTFCRQSEQERRPLKICLVIKEAMKMIRTFKPSNIEIREDYKDTSSIISGDPAQIHQVVMNLCTNSVGALKEKGGTITVRLESICVKKSDEILMPCIRPGSYVRLSVIDNGPGIPQNIIERIFDPFFTTKKSGEGTGLGLSIVHGIAERHGGSVSVESEPGKGAVFHIWFPLIAETEPPVKTEIFETAPQGNESLLLTDDEANLLKTYQEMLAYLGYDSDACHKCTDALSLFSSHPDKYDLVMMSNTTSDMPAELFIRKLIHIRPDIPIIVCSAGDDTLDEELMLAMGVSAFIMKPFTKDEIARLIRNVLDGQHHERNQNR